MGRGRDGRKHLPEHDASHQVLPAPSRGRALRDVSRRRQSRSPSTPPHASPTPNSTWASSKPESASSPAAAAARRCVLRSIEAGSSIRPDARGESVEIFEAIKKNFETIAKATVSTSAAEARSLGFLRASDNITMNRDRLLTDAKLRARALADAGYAAPIPRTDIPAPGESVLATLKLAVWTMREGQYISDHDAKVANWAAYILAEARSTQARSSANNISSTSSAKPSSPSAAKRKPRSASPSP